MSYSVFFQSETARIDYSGELTVEEIKRAHEETTGNMKFFECKHLIVDMRQCNLAEVSIPDLILVVANDLWTSRVLKSLKVAFIVQSFVNMEKTSEYINESRLSPWEYRLFETEDNAAQWLNE